MDRCLYNDSCQNRAYVRLTGKRLQDGVTFSVRLCLAHFCQIVDIFKLFDPGCIVEE